MTYIPYPDLESEKSWIEIPTRRSNADTGHHRGSLQAEWFFPIRNRVRGQLQLFSGYGESLIDFDHRQSTIGVGVLLFDPF